jgi:hypothetical protein
MSVYSMPKLTLAETAETVAACVRAKRVPLVLGPPGVAKTAAARALAPVIGQTLGLADYPAEICVLSNYDAVDVGGLPMVVNEEAERRIFGALKRAAESPRLLVLDEFFATAQSVQGPAMRLVLEAVAGEVPLHPETRIICIANPPEQSPAGISPACALINRVIILLCRPSVMEIATYFRDAEEADRTLRTAAAKVTVDGQEFADRREALMTEMSYLMEHRPEVVCFDPPDASINDGYPFASPRALEACCEALAAMTRDAGDDILVQAVVEGAIGQASGTLYLAIRKARARLPSIEEILANPDRAKVPDDEERDLQLAAIGLIVQASMKDSGAAWVYLDRFPDEFVMSIAKPMTRAWRTGSQTWSDVGRQIMMNVVAWTSELAKGNIKDRPRRKKAA